MNKQVDSIDNPDFDPLKVLPLCPIRDDESLNSLLCDDDILDIPEQIESMMVSQRIMDDENRKIDSNLLFRSPILDGMVLF